MKKLLKLSAKYYVIYLIVTAPIVIYTFWRWGWIKGFWINLANPVTPP